MSLLDEEDSFRSYQLERHDGVNAVIGNFVSEYSQTRVQRANETRQQIDQKKEKQDSVDNKNVGTTISEDLADGQTAKLEASLKLLSEDDLKLFIPNDELEDDEIHIIETTVGGPKSLEDYQVQLMLLEQQNKRRLLTARLESSKVRIQFEQAAARELTRRSERISIENKQIQTRVTQKSFVMNTGIALTIPRTKRRKREHRPQLDDSTAANGSQLVEVSHHCLEVRFEVY